MAATHSSKMRSRLMYRPMCREFSLCDDGVGLSGEGDKMRAATTSSPSSPSCTEKGMALAEDVDEISNDRFDRSV